MSQPVDEPRWYTYDFPAKSGVQCGLAGCTEQHPVVYVGKSNEPWRRHFEHLPKPWLPYTSGYRIHEKTYATERECLAAEEAMIRGSCGWRPLANDVHNRDNPHRLVFSAEPARAGAVARRRLARDAPPAPATAGWSRRQKRAAQLAAVWAVLAAAAAAGVAYLGAGLTVAFADGAGSGAVLLLAGWWCRPVKGVRRTRARRKRAGVLVVLTVVAVAWTLTPPDTPPRPAVPAVQR